MIDIKYAKSELTVKEWFDQLFEIDWNAVFVFFVLSWVHGPIKLSLVDVTVIVSYWAWKVVIRTVGWFCKGDQLRSDFGDQLIKSEADVFMSILVEETWSEDCTAVFFELRKSVDGC